MSLNIALLQMTSHGLDQQSNLKKGEQFCREAKAKGADIILFPEMWNIGYTPYDSTAVQFGYDPKAPGEAEKQATWRENAISEGGEFVSHFRALAKELNVAIAVTYLEKYRSSARNAVSLIDRFGEIVLTYAKVHTCDFSIESALSAGEEFFVSELNTEKGQVNIGAMICFDREFPESARILMLKGAEIILVPNACEMEQHRIAQLRTRAYENMLGIAMANYPQPEANGHSLAFSGIAFDNTEHQPCDSLMIEGDEKEGIYMAEFNLQALRQYRDAESWGNAYRKPNCYSALVDLKAE